MKCTRHQQQQQQHWKSFCQVCFRVQQRNFLSATLISPKAEEKLAYCSPERRRRRRPGLVPGLDLKKDTAELRRRNESYFSSVGSAVKTPGKKEENCQR